MKVNRPKPDHVYLFEPICLFYFVVNFAQSIDEIQYSDDSYDVDYVRKSTTSSTNSAQSQPKSCEDDEEKNGENFQQEKTNYLILSDHNLAEPSCDRRYAKTLCSFESVIYCCFFCCHIMN